jgi:cbb3-type cytochrome oxidase subunit 3
MTFSAALSLAALIVGLMLGSRWWAYRTRERKEREIRALAAQGKKKAR